MTSVFQPKTFHIKENFHINHLIRLDKVTVAQFYFYFPKSLTALDVRLIHTAFSHLTHWSFHTCIKQAVTTAGAYH